MNRKDMLNQWLKETIGTSQFSCKPASEDASFRSYYRIQTSTTDYIVMDAPPEHEDCHSFIKVQGILKHQGVNVPEIFAFQEQLGFMLLSDFGNELYLNHLNKDTCIALYQPAIDELLKIQSVKYTDQVPAYDRHLLQNELNLFSDWFIGTHLEIELTQAQCKTIQQVEQMLIDNAINQPQVFVHRDYHSRNIMLVNEKPGVIDFQDAVNGPITYDLASLLKDCYISWPREICEELVTYYITKHNQQHQPQLNYDEFINWFDLMAAQRHMKAIGIFCRLNYRDGKKQYLNDIPRTMKHLIDTCVQYPALQEFGTVLNDISPTLMMYK